MPPSDGSQSIAVSQASDKLLYHDLTNYCFMALPGETVMPGFTWESGLWMHGYIYLDLANDGEFDIVLNEDGNVAAGTDAVAFSCYRGYDSTGRNFDALNVGVNTPSFTIPTDLAPGLYRMRYKVDWNSIDPGGNDENGIVHQQLITTNGGAIADIMLYVHPQMNELEIISDKGKVYNSEGVLLQESGIQSGRDNIITFLPDDGYQVKNITVKSGYSIDNPDITVASQSLAAKEISFPGYMLSNNSIKIPAANTYGDVTLTVEYCDAGEILGGDEYECDLQGDKDPATGITGFSLGGIKYSFEAPTRHFFYTELTPAALKGEAQKLTVDYTAPDVTDVVKDISLYIDLNSNSVFDGQLELMTSAEVSGEIPEFTLPQAVPNGVYRCRLLVADECAVDFLLNIHETYGTVYHNVVNGFITGSESFNIPEKVQFGGTVEAAAYPTLPGFEAESVTVRHGHNLFGDQYICGNRQWQEFIVPAGEDFVVESDKVDGDIMIMGEFVESPDSEWTAIWSDEFNSGEFDTDKWSYHPRYNSTWNKRHAVGNKGRALVNRFEKGSYDSYAMPTPDSILIEENRAKVITGAIYSGGKFYMNGGYIEARMKTNPHIGNFPAFWMMPANQANGWPKDGEIDIMEQIDTEDRAYHTVHTAWRYKSFGPISQDSPAPGGNEYVDMSQWHIYALEWTPEELKWYVDGELRFTYSNMHFSEGAYTEFFTWPFSSPFYVILNQSVGDGSWAKPVDNAHTYLTQFDYVRAYQKKSELDYYSVADGHVSGIDGVISDEDVDAPAEFYNLQGIRVNPNHLTSGFYIVRKGNKVRKIFVHK